MWMLVGIIIIISSIFYQLSATAHIPFNTLFLSFIVIQSTDKNFLVPVGGAIVHSPSPTFLQDVAIMYPGRANMSPIFDLFVTFLSMGEDGLMELWTERQRLLVILQEKLQDFAERRGMQYVLFGIAVSTFISVFSLPFLCGLMNLNSYFLSDLDHPSILYVQVNGCC